MTTMTEPEGSPADEESHQPTFNSREVEVVQTRSIGVQRLCEEKGVSLLSLAERSGVGYAEQQHRLGA